jgi:hypothetical protein
MRYWPYRPLICLRYVVLTDFYITPSPFAIKAELKFQGKVLPGVAFLRYVCLMAYGFSQIPHSLNSRKMAMRMQ